MTVENFMDLLVIVTVLPENVPQEHQVHMHAVLIA
jgi:hypothetical protein